MINYTSFMCLSAVYITFLVTEIKWFYYEIVHFSS